MIQVLVVEDDENYAYEISEELESKLEEVAEFSYAKNLSEATEFIQFKNFDLMIMDIIFPLKEGDISHVDYKAGVKLLDFTIDHRFSGSILVLSSQDKSFAVDLLIKYKNVKDYAFKDSSWREIFYKVQKQIDFISEKKSLVSQVQERFPFIGSSNDLVKVKSIAKKTANLDTTILITGPSGVGKEVTARHFHSVSNRSLGAFIVVNCAAVPENLFESILFGHKKGAFTGATEDQTGQFEAADKGTIFLDEIGELPLMMQAKLLRVLQEKRITRVGELDPIDIDVRVIAATNRELEEAVENKTFREDLFFRLNVLPVKISPLKERLDDLAELSLFFVEAMFTKTGLKKSFSPQANELFSRYSWPGNIRELKNTIERLVILTETEIISYEDVVSVLNVTAESDYRVGFPLTNCNYKDIKQGVLDCFHRNFFSHYLRENNYQISKTAEQISYNRNDLSQHIKKLKLLEGEE
ncbi:MAG: sigma-54-dependent Fis family transcriptional regulator [Candidatus Cloacimonetes bacterium]|nr:sigma-54-dependent Fis family transcriptional regulator [Candidatus Cloacimonadota bacterium]